MNRLLQQMTGHSDALLALLAVFLIVCGFSFMRFKKTTVTPHMVACSSLMLALTILIGAFPLYRMPHGGSITLGGMLPLMLLGFAYGPEMGMLAGFTYSLIALVMEPYILHPVQLLFDYPLPFMALGCTGFFPGHRITGICFATILRLFFHFLSGVVFFGAYAPAGTSVYLYSLVTNLTYLLPNLMICLLLFKCLPVERFLSYMRR
jgi:thiamine transporter